MCTMACGDPAETPVASQPEPPSDEEAAAAKSKHAKGAAAPADANGDATDPAAEAAMVARRVRAHA